MRLNSNLILRQVGGEYMIVNPFSETMDMAQMKPEHCCAINMK